MTEENEPTFYRLSKKFNNAFFLVFVSAVVSSITAYYVTNMSPDDSIMSVLITAYIYALLSFFALAALVVIGSLLIEVIWPKGLFKGALNRIKPGRKKP